LETLPLVAYMLHNFQPVDAKGGYQLMLRRPGMAAAGDR